MEQYTIKQALLLYPIFFPIVFLYFYNLLHDTQKQGKNLAIRIMLIGFTPLMGRLFNAPIDSLASIGLILCTPFLIVLLFVVCCMKFQILNNGYLYHLAFIYAYCLGMLYIYNFYNDQPYPYEKELLGYLTTPSLCILLVLIVYWIIASLLYSKSFLTRHDKVCLVLCFSLEIIADSFNPFFKSIFDPPILFIIHSLGSWVWFVMAGFWLLVLIATFAVTLHHSYYFLKLFFTKKRNV